MVHNNQQSANLATNELIGIREKGDESYAVNWPAEFDLENSKDLEVSIP